VVHSTDAPAGTSAVQMRLYAACHPPFTGLLGCGCAHALQAIETALSRCCAIVPPFGQIRRECQRAARDPRGRSVQSKHTECYQHCERSLTFSICNGKELHSDVHSPFPGQINKADCGTSAAFFNCPYIFAMAIVLELIETDCPEILNQK
jgi:hypothetical protein